MLHVNYMLKSIGDTTKFAFTSHAEYEVYYFHHGKCTYLIGNRVYNLSPGDLIIMDGTVLHRPNPHPDVEYCRTNVLFDPKIIQGLQTHPDMLDLMQPFQKLRNSRIHVDENRRFACESVFEQMSRCASGKSAMNRQRRLILLLQLLVEIYDACKDADMERSCIKDAKESIVEKVIETIDNQYFQDISLDQISETLHLSKFYISHTFKELTGVTIMDFVMNRRIRQAKFLFVVENEMSVTEMSYRVGFKHLAHFSRVFKDKVGLTPDQYRKQIRNRQYSEIDI